MNFYDLRSVLNYTYKFRDNTFIISLDSSVILSSNLSNIILDILALKLLNIKIIITYGLCENISINDSNKLYLEILTYGKTLVANLSKVKINSLHINNEKQEFSFSKIINLLDKNIIPILSPINTFNNRENKFISPEEITFIISESIKVHKIIFITSKENFNQDYFQSNTLSEKSYKQYLDDENITENLKSKIHYSILSTSKNVPRSHIINDSTDDALLSELFSNEGIGLMIHSDTYIKIRKAYSYDVDIIYLLIHQAVEKNQLLSRSRKNILQYINDYIVIEVDENIIACVAVHNFSNESLSEMACLFVKKGHLKEGYSRILVQESIKISRNNGSKYLFALSNQAEDYFKNQGFLIEESLDFLPDLRRKEYMKNRRNSTVFKYKL